MTNGTANFVDLIHSITNRHFKRSSKSLFILTLLLLFDQQSTFAQFRERPPIPIPDKTISVGIRNDYFNTPGLDQVLGYFAYTRNFKLGKRFIGWRTAPALTGQVTILGLALGGRFNTSGLATLRWHATLVQADFNYYGLAFGASALDLDKSGLPDRDFRWASLSLNLGGAGRPSPMPVSGRLKGSVGVSSIFLDKTNYPEIAANNDFALKGIEASYKGTLYINLEQFVILSVEYGERVVYDGPEPHFKTLGVETLLRPSGRKISGFLFRARYEREETDFSNNSLNQKNHRFVAGIQFVLE